MKNTLIEDAKKWLTSDEGKAALIFAMKEVELSNFELMKASKVKTEYLHEPFVPMLTKFAELLQANSEPRFFLEHGIWHERVTGQHMYNQDEYDELRRDAFHHGYQSAKDEFQIKSEANSTNTVDEITYGDTPDNLNDEEAHGYVKGWNDCCASLANKPDEQAITKG